MERGDSSCSYAYLRAREMRRDLGRFEASPFPPWSKDDLDWLAGMDDSSGSYGEVAPIPDSANGAKASEKAPEGSCKIGTKDHQLSLLDSQEEHNSEEGQAMQCMQCMCGGTANSKNPSSEDGFFYEAHREYSQYISPLTNWSAWTRERFPLVN